MTASPSWRIWWTFLGIYSVLFYFLVAFWILTQDQGWKILLMGIGIGVFARVVLAEIIHRFYKKPHPYQRLNLNTPKSWLFSEKDLREDAFPSEHSTILSAFSVATFWFYPTAGLATLAVAVFLPVARIVLGYHDIWDVLAGWALGVITAIILLSCLTPIILK